MTDHSASPGASAPLWHGRFDRGPAEELWEFSVSLPYDQRLAPFDLRGCAVHVEGLARVGIISADEAKRVTSALDVVAGELERGTFAFAPTDEDIHTAIERRVTELAGEAGAKLHTGRSRNDQVATAFRLFVRDAIAQVATRVLSFQQTLLDRARSAEQTYLPGYTHMQQAQPVLLAHHLLAHSWALSRDLDRLIDASRRANVSPLGAGALAGSSLPLDPAGNAKALGFDRPFENSLDVTSDRDFVAEMLFDLALLGVHLSRMGEEIVLWSTAEFAFLDLDDAYATGSSMLPQKKNPDIAELARGKTGRLIGNLTALLATLKSLPLAYNRDLQEDKEPLFDSIDTVLLAIAALDGVYATSRFNAERMAEAADSPYAAATDLAELLVRQGVPFREAHATVGALVRRSIDDGLSFVDLVRNEPQLWDEGAKLLEPGASVKQRTSPGGAGPAPVAVQLEQVAAQLETDRARVARLS
jgi:argininosuccinate lyase